MQIQRNALDTENTRLRSEIALAEAKFLSKDERTVNRLEETMHLLQPNVIERRTEQLQMALQETHGKLDRKEQEHEELVAALHSPSNQLPARASLEQIAAASGSSQCILELENTLLIILCELDEWQKAHAMSPSDSIQHTLHPLNTLESLNSNAQVVLAAIRTTLLSADAALQSSKPPSGEAWRAVGNTDPGLAENSAVESEEPGGSAIRRGDYRYGRVWGSSGQGQGQGGGSATVGQGQDLGQAITQQASMYKHPQDDVGTTLQIALDNAVQALAHERREKQAAIAEGVQHCEGMAGMHRAEVVSILKALDNAQEALAQERREKSVAMNEARVQHDIVATLRAQLVDLEEQLEWSRVELAQLRNRLTEAGAERLKGASPGAGLQRMQQQEHHRFLGLTLTLTKTTTIYWTLTLTLTLTLRSCMNVLCKTETKTAKCRSNPNPNPNVNSGVHARNLSNGCSQKNRRIERYIVVAS